MKKYPEIIVTLAVAACLVGPVSQTPAQVNVPQRMQQNRQAVAADPRNQPVPVSPSGKIEAIRMGMVKIATESGESWMVKIPNSAKIHVLGAAKIDYLRPGMFVLFKVNLDQRGNAQEKVAELKVFTPTQSSNLGMFPESGFSGGPDAAIEAKAEAEVEKKAKAKRSVKATDKATKLQAAAYEVSGQIASVKRNGEWLIKTPQGDVSVQLDENAAISLDLADYSFAKPGDSINCKALQNSEFTATADSVQIELTQPLPYGDEKKSLRSKPTQSRDSKTKHAAGNAADNKEATEKLAALLEPKGSDANGETLQLTVKGKKLSFQPSTQGPAATLQKRFGRPKKTYATGAVSKADGATASPERWQIWIWGDVQVAVDRRGKARFYLVESAE